MPETTEAFDIIEAGRESARPHELIDGSIYAIRSGDTVNILTTPGYIDDRADRPRRVCRDVIVKDVASFLDYISDYVESNGVIDAHLVDEQDGTIGLEVWADVDRQQVVGIIDGISGWRSNRVTLQLSRPREWAEWERVDGNLLNQVEFAQFIEDHLSTIGAPDGADLLDVCQTLQATKSVDFKSSQILASGERKFRFEETIDAKAGAKGELTIPSELTLVLRPFQGSDPVGIQARFRYRIDGSGRLLIGVRLNEPEKVLEDAFDVVVGQLRKGLGERATIRFGNA